MGHSLGMALIPEGAETPWRAGLRVGSLLTVEGNEDVWERGTSGGSQCQEKSLNELKKKRESCVVPQQRPF